MPYYLDDFTNVNRVCSPIDAIKPERIRTLKKEEMEELLNEDNSYTKRSLFVYDAHRDLPTYTVSIRKVETPLNTYMIDFRHTCKVGCKKIIKPEEQPIDSRVLELSDETRKELLDKLIFFYTREEEALP